MARKKKYYNHLDENAPKIFDLHFRVNGKEMLDLNKIKHKTNLSKSAIFREALKCYFEKVFSED